MPYTDLITGPDQERMRAVRTEPAQRRSSQRLDTLLDAVAALVVEVGPERVTTQLVAERAGASIGTVYRYFPDRVALIDALAARAVRRFRERVAARLDDTELDHWSVVFDIAVDVCAEMYLDEPGFSLVHRSGLEMAADGEPEIAHRLARLLEAAFGPFGADGAELRFRVGVAIELGAALVRQAFRRSASGDERYLDEAKRVVRGYLEPTLEAAASARRAA